MSEGRPAARVGVRELRQNLSVYLRRVEQGETLDVTEHGRPVAQLRPIEPATSSTLDRLISAGLASASSRGIAELIAPAESAPGQLLLSEVLRQAREQERT